MPGPNGDRELWESVIAFADRETVAPSWHFGKYVHPTAPRSVLRTSIIGRSILLSTSLDSSTHERKSDAAEFVAWDGEGITYAEGMPQQYVLFGCSTGHAVEGHSLSTINCLETIMEAGAYSPNAIHVGFAFKYDAEMILRDLTYRSWQYLRRHGTTRYQGYQISYHPGKMFRVSKKTAQGKEYQSVTIYDVWGFFQGSFVRALRSWLDETELHEINRIEEGKAERGVFTYDQLDTFIKPYWQAELRLLVLLAGRLRERLLVADICPKQWHGAGALATTLYSQHSTRQHMARTNRDWHISKDKDLTSILPEEVNKASQHAYAGGRFELFKMGHTDQTVYQYDINSAYPDGISLLPSMKGAEWHYTENVGKIHKGDFGLYEIDYDYFDPSTPGPLPYRDWQGRVSFPGNVKGWYWTPEAYIIQQMPGVRIVSAWLLEHDHTYPFAWVRELYDERKRRKAAGDPSEKAYKLGLNSLYGKMAQRVGYQAGGALPRFHQLEWAGYVTSWTRAKLYLAIWEAGDELIACETDAVFTTKKLETIAIGPGLGEWEYTQHEWMTYLQSGTYWSNHGSKYRGFDHGSIPHDAAMQWLRRADFATPLIGKTTRFVGAGAGLGTPLHRCWVTDSRDLSPGRSGKRVHIPDVCPNCIQGDSPADVMHQMLTTVRGGRSFPHSLPWLGDNTTVEWQEMYDMESWDEIDCA